MRVAFFVFVAIIFFPAFVNADIIINEIAWMGALPKEGESTQAAANNEWLELYNSSASDISLEGWALSSSDLRPNISLSGSIPANGYYLMERTSDDVVPGISADLIYPYKDNALSNTGEHLFLKGSSGNIVDEVDALSGWPAGDNITKETMQRNGNSWVTALATPKASNIVSLPPPPPTPPDPPSAPPPPQPPPPGSAPEPSLESALTPPASNSKPQSVVSAPPAASNPSPAVEDQASEPLSPKSQTSSEPAVSQLMTKDPASIPTPQTSETINNDPAPTIKTDEGALVEEPLEDKPADDLQLAVTTETLSDSKKFVFSSSWFWFSVAATFGLLSAGAVFVIRKLN